MPKPKTNYFQRRSKPQGPKANERIRALDVQVISSSGNNLGVLPLKKAIETAKEEGNGPTITFVEAIDGILFLRWTLPFINKTIEIIV